MKKMANKPTSNRNAKFRSSGKPKPNNQRRNRSVPVKGRVSKRRPPVKSTKVQDARQKIQQKKRKSVTDAREILAGMAKTQDARNKLNKMRQTRPGGGSSSSSSGRDRDNVRQIGTHILRKTDRNGKISLVTNKAKAAHDINVAIQKQLGLIPSQRVAPKKSPAKRPSIRKEPYVVKSPVMDDYAAYAAPLRAYESSMYKWTKQGGRSAASQMIGALEARRQVLDEQLMQNERWPQFTVTRPARDYIDLDAVMDDAEMPLLPIRQTISLQGSSRVSNVHSRLDTSPIQPESHGILSQPKTKVVVPAGHRIVVSNLQATVSQDDIKELFEDIGQLLAARLVRPGVAEVIYKNLKDAQKAVDTYHNRQLDGQPMKCLLVNKRPLNNPTAAPITKSESQGTQPRKPLPTPNAVSKLVPDIQTIHKVLFQRK